MDMAADNSHRLSYQRFWISNRNKEGSKWNYEGSSGRFHSDLARLGTIAVQLPGDHQSNADRSLWHGETSKSHLPIAFNLEAANHHNQPQDAPAPVTPAVYPRW